MHDPSEPVRTANHLVRLLPDMSLLLDSVYRDVEAARARVMVQCFIYRDDELGAEFAEVLARAAARGVPTRLLYDPLGSKDTPEEFFDGLRARGVQVRSYRHIPVVLGSADPWPREHGRIIVADDAAYTGGAAWAKPWLPIDRGGDGWHDVCSRTQGPCVEDFVALFEQRWREAEGGAGVSDYDTKDRYPDVRIVSDSPKRDSLVYNLHEDAFSHAKKRIWVANAYFFPPPPMLDALAGAAARGVDVRVVLPGESDLPTVQHAAAADYGTWLDRGLRVFEYQGVVMHSKYSLVDDDWCSVGTFNVNSTSVGLTNEVNLFVYDPAFVARCAAQFERDLARSKEVTRAAIAGKGFVERAKDELGRDVMRLADAVWGPKRS
ncbi:MAG TPA: phosphatidylserine/phosphatidylglycerophosphate/cardiolipin synthase family protein [Polyangiaceae bacterium]|nr:phosphatidylserine/phosphatidylglycerophosphate/cardiolipin synthase family protein [Polyangiaceae bacterium]